MSVSDQIHPLVRRHGMVLCLGALLCLLAFMPGTDFHFRVLALVCVFALAAVRLHALMPHPAVVSTR